MAEQQVTERGADGAEGHGGGPGAAAALAGEGDAQVGFLQDVGGEDVAMGQHETRGGVGLPERPGLRDEVGEFQRDRVRVEAGVDGEAAGVAVLLGGGAEAGFEIIVEGGEVLLRHGESGGHGVPSPADEQPLGAGAGDGRAKIDAGHGARAALADAVAKRDHGGGAVEFFLQAPGDDADDALVPALMGHQQHGAVILPFGEREGLFQHAGLDGLALGVVLREALGECGGFLGILGGEQLQAEAGFADAPAGVDARAKDEPGMVGAGGFVEPRRIEQGADAGVALGGHHLQSLLHQRAVEAGQRHDIADGAERDEVEEVEEVGLFTRCVREVPTTILPRK